MPDFLTIKFKNSMGRSKDLFMQMMEEMMTPWTRITQELERLKRQEEKPASTESWEVTKGSYKTKISYGFNKEGYPVDYSHTVEYIPTEAEKNENQLQLYQRELNEALEKQDFLKCAEVKRQIDELKQVKTN